MKLVWQLFKNLRSLKKSGVWPLVLELVTAFIAWVKHQPGSLERFFGAVMALLVYLMAHYYSPEVVAGPAYRAGVTSSATLRGIIPDWERVETVGQATLDVAKREYFKGLDSDDGVTAGKSPR